MSRLELVGTTLWFIAIVVAATGFGAVIVQLLARLLPDENPAEQSFAERFGACLLIGLGSLGWLAALAGVFGVFSKATLVAVGLAAFALSLPRLPARARRFQARLAAIRRGSHW